MEKSVNTMWLSRIKYIVLLSIFTFCNVVAQTVDVKDPVFKNYLCSKYPNAMTANCAQLDIQKADTEYTGIHLFWIVNKGLTNADEILHFKNIDTIYLNQNALTTFPDDISGFRNLVRLNLAANKLRTVPTIKYNNPISGDTGVKLVYMMNNLIDHFPTSWYSENNISQVIDLNGNLLKTIPDFTKYKEIRRLNVQNNYLGFESLIPIKKHPLFSTSIFELFPQKEFDLNVDSTLIIGDTMKIDVSTGLSSNEYILLKEDRKIETNRTGKFILPILSDLDSGNYWVKIRNDSFPSQSDFLATKKVYVSVKKATEKEESKNVFVFSPDGDGIADSFVIEGTGDAYFYDKSGKQIRVEKLPFEWFGKDKNDRSLAPGLYFIIKQNDQIVKVLIAN